ncbi:MAG: T9SS type A sorting domain-containing protein [Rhodothermales bacterium]|nr:T9SS type A sorting domain-containing protein [Rhodothermales bacterium]
MTSSILRVSILSTVLLLFATADVQAQLTVVSSSPADGMVNVSTSVILQIEFSAPIDTTARFDDDEDFYLAFETNPEIPEPTLAGVSPDFTTFFAQVQLEPDTRYLVLLTGAKSQAGDILSQPFVVNFTTGSSMPTGSISGTVTDASSGKTAAGALVAIFPDDPLNGIFGEDSGLFGATVTNSSGQYTVNYVPDGFYQVASAADVTGDGLIEPESGDTFGLYDSDGNGLLDAVEVSGGGGISGIDFSIKVPTPVSARSNLPRATPIAASIESDAELVMVNGQFGPGGLSPQWLYVYYSPSNLANFVLFALGDQFGVSPYQDFGGGTDMTEPLPEDFLDSDVVGGIANDNGGSDFLSQFPDAEVFGFAASVTDSFGSGKKEDTQRWRSAGIFDLSYPVGMGLSASSAAAALVTPTPLWIVNYNAFLNEPPFFGFLNVIIHAVTGEVDPALAYYTAARANLDVADAAVATNFPGGFLVMVESSNFGLHKSGVSAYWTYTYRSPANTVYSIDVQEGVILEQGFGSLTDLRSTQAIPDGWIDSPQATAAAEAESGGFRDANPDAFVEVVLAQELDSNNPLTTIWEFSYLSSTASDFILINAGTGLVVGIEDDKDLPSTLRLDQNYPNPFNPETSINYEVPAGGNVRLLIFDLLGRQVRTLVERDHAAGRYTVVWDGADENGRAVSSGIYVYRVEAVGGSETRSMTLLR